VNQTSEIVTRFRKLGFKITPQRLGIFKLLRNNHSHPSAEDIYREILKVHPSISFTTVYKTLQTLRDLGEINELRIDPERAHYDPNVRDHAHTFCKSCGKISDLEYQPGISAKEMDNRMSADFEVHSFQVHAVGLCSQCKT